MEKGNYYWMQQNDARKRIWIIKCVDFENFGICGPCISITDGILFPTDSRWGNSEQISHHRLATSEEIAWLDACIAARKFVPQPVPEIINSYEIY